MTLENVLVRAWTSRKDLISGSSNKECCVVASLKPRCKKGSTASHLKVSFPATVLLYYMCLRIALHSDIQGSEGQDFAVLANPLGLLFRGVVGDPGLSNWQPYANVALQLATFFRRILTVNVPESLQSSYIQGFNEHLIITLFDAAALLSALRLNTAPDYLTQLLQSHGVYDFDTTWPSGLEPQQRNTLRGASNVQSEYELSVSPVLCFHTS